MDLNILAALANRQRYKRLSGAVPMGMIEADTQILLAWYNVYFQTFPDQPDIVVDELISLIRLRSQSSTPEQVAVTLHLAEKLRTPVSEGTVHGLVSQLHELDLSGKAGALIHQYNEGEDVDLAYELQMMATGVRRSIAEGQKASWANGSILDSLTQDDDEGGLQWTLFDLLHQALKGAQKGDNIAVCAPTDQGKTSLLCAIAVDFQRQAKVLYPGQPLLYLVNEGTQERVRNRMYQTVAGVEREQLIEMARDGSLDTLYNKEMGGFDAIRVVNCHGKNLAQISRIIEQHKPHTVITDMTGRIKAMSNKGGGANDIGQLEEVWNDMRELAVIQDFLHIGTVQVSAEGFNMLYPPVSALQNSKTGIQTTLDLCLMMGALTNADMRTLRGISTPKNKLARSGMKSLVMFEAWFQAGINKWSTGG